MKNTIIDLKNQFQSTRNKKKRAEINAKMRALSEESPNEFGDALRELIKETATELGIWPKNS